MKLKVYFRYVLKGGSLQINAPIRVTDTTKKKYKSLREIFTTSQKIKLANFIAKLNLRDEGVENGRIKVLGDSLTEEEARQIVQPMNQEILLYLSNTYPQLGSTSMVDINDPDFTYFAQIYNIAEQSNLIIPNGAAGPIYARDQFPTWLRCTVDIVMGYFDVRALISTLGTFEFGTVWTVLKFAIKKYVGWIAAAILIYDISTECL